MEVLHILFGPSFPGDAKAYLAGKLITNFSISLDDLIACIQRGDELVIQNAIGTMFPAQLSNSF